MDITTISRLYADIHGLAPAKVTELPSSGSNRRYFRLSDDDGSKSLIGVLGTSKEENNAFIYMARHLASKGIPVPELLAVSDDGMAYIQTDLGDTLLFNEIEKGRLTRSFSAHEKEMLAKTISRLPDIQFAGADGMDFGVCYPAVGFDRRSIMWDLNYFKYCFLKATGLEFQEDMLEDDFNRLTDVLLEASQGDTFMYRDFQSRNVMIREGEPWFIDFQGGRRGPFYYDVASFLWQAKANLPEGLRRELLDVYLESLNKYTPISRKEFMGLLRHFVLFRTLQVLGAYGVRGYFEKKPHFMQSVPFAIANLRQLLHEPYVEYPYLNDLLHRLVDLKQFADQTKRQLTVRVMSFAYKKGIPNDTSGNGGGFVFDCRAINNPGKYERYKPFTGLDPQVIQFLEDDGEVLTFLEHCYALTDASVQRYIDRGFTSLMIAYGCTGGQHRSVYCAQHTAEHIARKFNVKVELMHREQDMAQTFNVK